MKTAAPGSGPGAAEGAEKGLDISIPSSTSTPPPQDTLISIGEAARRILVRSAWRSRKPSRLLVAGAMRRYRCRRFIKE